MAHQKLGNGQNTEIETDIAVVAPSNMGKTLVFDGEVYNVNIGSTLQVTEQGLVEVKLSKDKGNLIEQRKDGIYYGVEPPKDTSNLYVSSSQGNDSNTGTKDSPLRTINEAFKRNRPGQHFRINLFESDRHEWRTSWGVKNGYTYNVQPYGPVYDRVLADNVANSTTWARSQELKRPTIEFVFDANTYDELVTLVQQQFSDKEVVFNGVKFTARAENDAPKKTYGVFGGATSYVNIIFRGCEFDLNAPTHYLHIGKPTSPVIFDHTRFDGNGYLGHIEENGSMAVGFRGIWDGGARGAVATGNTTQGTPTSLTYNGANSKEEHLAKFKGNTVQQRVGIIY